jgi:hypothetical protein
MSTEKKIDKKDTKDTGPNAPPVNRAERRRQTRADTKHLKKEINKKDTKSSAPSSETPPGRKSEFSLASFRVEDDNFVSQDGHRELTGMYAGKPKKALAHRTWPDLCVELWLYTNDVTRVTYPVHPAVLEKWPSLRDECQLRRLYLAVDSEGDPWIWETAIPQSIAPEQLGAIGKEGSRDHTQEVGAHRPHTKGTAIRSHQPHTRDPRSTTSDSDVGRGGKIGLPR